MSDPRISVDHLFLAEDRNNMARLQRYCNALEMEFEEECQEAAVKIGEIETEYYDAFRDFLLISKAKPEFKARYWAQLGAATQELMNRAEAIWRPLKDSLEYYYEPEEDEDEKS